MSYDTPLTPTAYTPNPSPATALLRPRVCVYGTEGDRHVCTPQTGAYAVRDPRTGFMAAACGPCFARVHGADAPHGHPVGRFCPVCASVKGQVEA